MFGSWFPFKLGLGIIGEPAAARAAMPRIRTGDRCFALRASLEQLCAVVDAEMLVANNGNGAVAAQAQPVRDDDVRVHHW